MKVFISWSGEISYKVAKILKDWIPCVIQGIEPYFSSDDIDKGTRWSTDIATELEKASFGILCVTRENLTSQWLNFEAGALSKAIEKSKVCPFLFDLKPVDLSGSPILQFQMTNVDRADMLKLFQTMNKSLGNSKLEDTVLEKVFTAFWPQIDAALKEIESNKTEVSIDDKKVNQDIMLEEMLGLLRSQQIMLRSPDKLIPKEYMFELLQFDKEQSDRDIRNIVREFIPKEIQKNYTRINRRIREINREYGQGNIASDEARISCFDYFLEYYEISHSIMRKLGLLPMGFAIPKPRSDENTQL